MDATSLMGPPLLRDRRLADASARVRVLARPLHAAQYVDAHISSSALVDVVLQLASSPSSSSSSSPGRILHVQRCLHDFMQLQHELAREVGSSTGIPLIAPAISTYLSCRDGTDSDALATALYGRGERKAALFEARFAWQLELFLATLIEHVDPQVSSSRALKRFLHGGDSASLVTKDALAQWFAGGPDDATHAAVVRERIPSGCTVDHTTRVRVRSTPFDGAKLEGGALVVWRFASRGERVVFSARFAEKMQQLSEGDGDEAHDPYSTDPYSAFADEGSMDSRSQDEGESSEYMAHYRTSYAFPEAAAEAVGEGNDSEAANLSFVHGCFVAAASGELVLEWENADTTSILSKPLAFQVHVLPLEVEGGERAAGADEAAKRLLLGRDTAHQVENDGADEVLWVEELIAASKVASLDQVLNQNDDDDGDEEDDNETGSGFAGLSLDAPAAATDTESATVLVRVREEKHFYEQRAREFEERASELEGVLLATKSELKKAQSDIAISEEIYKASLEAITQLEVAASAAPQHASSASQEAHAAPSSSETLAIPSLLGMASSSHTEYDNGFAKQPKEGASVPHKEHERVVNLCTTFQEQCLWRAIELAESEKRCLTLEARLRDSEQERAELLAQIGAYAETVATLQAETKKLRTHKSILVQEVKKLQPYSQINISALVQEAQEARMMQRSLQAQLDSRGDTAATASASSTLSIAAEEDGAGGGFVVVESENHSSVFNGAEARE